MKKIIIVTTNPYPNGGAVANRITCLAKGIMLNGGTVELLIIRPTEDRTNIRNHISGNISGMAFRYTTKTNVKSINKFKVILAYFGGITRSIRCIRNACRNSDSNIILITYLHDFKLEIMYYILCNVYGIYYVKEESEYPEIYFWHKGMLNYIKKILYVNLCYKLYDAIIVITNTLIKYLTQLASNKAKILLVPMMVDLDRFASSEAICKQAYICYCGSINYKKDGINFFIEAFSRLSVENRDIYLFLVGDLNDNFEKGLNKGSFINRLKELSISEHVKWFDQVSNDEIIPFLVNAKILVLPRPSSRQSEGGFPTKLGEYLATGKPVITTSVGEIPNYLIDDFDCFMCKPGDSEDLYRKMKYVLENYGHAIEVGLNGRMSAKRFFDPVNNTYEFMKQMAQVNE